MANPELTSLPAELVKMIAENIQERTHLASLVRACRRIQVIVEPVLYKRDMHHPGGDRPYAMAWAALFDSKGTIQKLIDYGADISEPIYSSIPLPQWATIQEERFTQDTENREPRAISSDDDGGGDDDDGDDDDDDDDDDDAEDDAQEGDDGDDWASSEDGNEAEDEDEENSEDEDSDGEVMVTEHDPGGFAGRFDHSFVWQALHIAVYKGHRDMVGFLVDHGADIEAISYGICECQDDVRVTRRPMWSSAPYFWWTPLHTAICQGHDDLVRDLVARRVSVRGPASLARRYKPTITALHTAAVQNNAAVMELLLEKYALDINLREDNEGPTPLYFACMKWQWDAVSWLVERGAEIDVDTEGRSILPSACRAGNFALAMQLLDLGVRPGTDPRSDMWDSRAAINIAGSSGSGEVLLDPDHEKQRRILLQKLIARGWDPHQVRDRFGPPPLSFALRAQVPTAVDVLLQAGVDPTTVDPGSRLYLPYGGTPLTLACHTAVREPQCIDRGLECIQLLLDRGAPINQRCKVGITALSYLCSSESYLYHDGSEAMSEVICRVAEYLLHRGATADFRNGYWQHGCGLYDPAMRQLLIKYGICIPDLLELESTISD